MRIETHILFWDKESYGKALKCIRKKVYKDKKIDGFILLPFHSLVKYIEDFTTYAMLTKSGLIQQKRHEFNNWEDLEKVLEKIDLEKFLGIWGKFIIQMK